MGHVTPGTFDVETVEGNIYSSDSRRRFRGMKSCVAGSWRNCYELVRITSTDLAKMVLGQLSVDLKCVQCLRKQSHT